MATDHVSDCKRLLRMYYLVTSVPVELTAMEADRFEGMRWKVFEHATSAVHLAETPIGLPHDTSLTFHDVPSLLTLARAALEGSLALQYVLLSPDPAERLFRTRVWTLGGFLERRNTATFTERGKAIRDSDLEEAGRLKQELLGDRVFKALPAKRQTEALAGKWRGPHKWHQIAGQVGYDVRFFTDAYSFLSGTAHSSGLAAFLAWKLKGVPAQREYARSAITHLKVPIAKVLLAYIGRFPHTKAMLDREPEEAELVNLCSQLDSGWSDASLT